MLHVKFYESSYKYIHCNEYLFLTITPLTLIRHRVLRLGVLPFDAAISLAYRYLSALGEAPSFDEVRYISSSN